MNSNCHTTRLKLLKQLLLITENNLLTFIFKKQMYNEQDLVS